MKRKIGKGLMFAGALLVLGTAGDSDTGALDIKGAALKAITGIMVFAVGYILYKKAKSSKQGSEDSTQKHINLNSKQDATSAYTENYSTVQAKCQPRYEQSVGESGVIEC